MGNRERQVRYDRDVLGGEGSDEAQFFAHLCALYLDDVTELTIRNGRGGTPKQAVKIALRNLSQIGAYRHRMMVFDGDKSDRVVQDGIDECKKDPKIKCVVSNNRFEAEMGKILGCDARIMAKLQGPNGEVAKEEFDRICPPCEKRYEGILTKKILEERRKESDWLDAIISFIEGQEI